MFKADQEIMTEIVMHDYEIKPQSSMLASASTAVEFVLAGFGWVRAASIIIWSLFST